MCYTDVEKLLKKPKGAYFMVRIFSDSTCDLSDELLKRYDITLLPLYIILGDEQYKDRVNITPQDIFKWSDEHKTTPKTSAASLATR